MLRFRISKQDIIAFFFCFSFVPVHAVQKVIGSNGYLVLMILCIAIITIETIKSRIIAKSRLFIIWFVLLLWMAICSITNNVNPLYSFYYVGRVSFWFLLNDLYLKKRSLRLLKTARKYIGIVILITAAQQIVAPRLFGTVEGSSGNLRTFFASDNFLGYYYTAFIALCVILDFVEHNKIRKKTYVLTGICMLSICISWAVKNVIGIGLLILYILFVYRKRIANRFGPKTLLVIYIGVFILAVFANVQAGLFEIIGKVFGKDTTFTVRFYLWSQAIHNVRSSPLFGYGIPDGGHMKLQVNFGGNARSSHNMIFELLIAGGFPGLGIYLVFIIRCLFTNYKYLKTKYRYEYLFLIFNVFLFCLIQLGSGSIYYPFYYMPFILLYNLDEIIKIKERKYVNQESVYSN